MIIINVENWVETETHFIFQDSQMNRKSKKMHPWLINVLISSITNHTDPKVLMVLYFKHNSKEWCCGPSIFTFIHLTLNAKPEFSNLIYDIVQVQFYF